MEEQLIKTIFNMGEISLFVIGCVIAVKYFKDKDNTNTEKLEEKDKDFIRQLQKNEENRIQESNKVFNKLIEVHTEEKEMLISTIKDINEENKQRDIMYRESIAKFSEAIELNNKSILEISMQVSNIGERIGGIENDIQYMKEDAKILNYLVENNKV